MPYGTDYLPDRRSPPGKRADEIPRDDLFLTPSCVLGALNPSTEALIPRLYDLLGLRWKTAAGPGSECSCCSGILAHGDVMTFESTLLVAARIWSVAAELGLQDITTACVTSFAIHSECLELLELEPELRAKVDRWLERACGRRLVVPRRVVHASDVVWLFREELAQRLRHRLFDRVAGRPLRVADHVGCHYAKVFPDRAVGGEVRCEVLTGPIRAWGGETVEYPERRHCCGMGFRQCMMPPNRGYTLACVLRKLESMAPYEPDLVLTNCPGCNVFLDKEQHAIRELTGRSFDIPVLSYTELAGLLLGWDPYDAVGIQYHTVPLEPLLERIGIPHDPSRAFLAPAGARG
jgi:heterodisulfide reductase subunit B